MSKVALIRCESYNYQEVKKSVAKGIELLGGISLFARKGENILLKPNILVGEKPEKCVTTNPAVFEAVAELFLSSGANISYGDSPAIGNLAGAAKKAGLAEVADKLDIRMADFKNRVDLFFKKGIQNKKFTIAKAVTDNDGVISIPKLKTHGLEKLTGAVKNQFGCIPGVLKGEFHVKLPHAEDFAKMLVDLNNLIKPRLYIMDGVYAMEGNGPRGGTQKKMNILLFSKDPIALDATVCRLIDLNPKYVPTIKYGAKSGAGTYLENEIELVGDEFKQFLTTQFKVNKRPLKPYKPGSVVNFLNNSIVQKPYIINKECIQCGICIDMCPAKPKALFFNNSDKSLPPIYNYDNCIRCFCCQEICPQSAVLLRTPLLRKLINLFLKR